MEQNAACVEQNAACMEQVSEGFWGVWKFGRFGLFSRFGEGWEVWQVLEVGGNREVWEVKCMHLIACIMTMHAH